MNKRNGFFSCIFSLIPGAGHMYIGLLKKGTSIMALFFLCVALSSYFSLSVFAYILPVIWAYSFFDFWNLRRMSSEDFSNIIDMPVLSSTLFNRDFMSRHSASAGLVLAIIGAAIVLRLIRRAIWYVIPSFMQQFISSFIYYVPKLIVAAVLIGAGIYLISRKKKELEQDNHDR